MPTYDYECTACNYKFELFQMMSAEPEKVCPKCKKKKLKRLIGSGMGIIFKGSGFYETDYKRKEPAKTSKTKTGGSETAVSQPAKESSSFSGSDSAGSSAKSKPKKNEK